MVIVGSILLIFVQVGGFC